MKDKKDGIIYVGKALSLTKRVHQYFQASHDEGIKKARMVENIVSFEYIVTDSEVEALILENNLIKEHRPKYNTLLRDDKTYPFIKVSMKERYPRVLFTRQVKKDGAKYFGPFPGAGSVREMIDLVNKLFKLRTCNRRFPRDFGKERPCLNYHMDQCSGVCRGDVDEEEYGRRVDAAVSFLNGNDKEIIEDLKRQMQQAAEEMEFEKAASFRDLLKSISNIREQQKITNTAGEDKDVIAMAMDEGDCLVQIFFVRGGKMIGRDHFFIQAGEEDDERSVISAFIQQFYSGTPVVPREIFLQTDPVDKDLIEKWLTEKRGQRVYVRVPRRGEKEKLVELAMKNAQMTLARDKDRIRREEGRTIGAMKEIAGLIGMDHISRLEAYDISNTNGFESVGSMVVFEGGKPLKSDYRKFKLKTIEGPDDYGSMREVLTRRFSHGIKEREELSARGMDDKMGSFTRFPDVIMMDGGKGQVNIANSVLFELGLDIPVCGMVKDDHHRTRGLYFKGEEVPIDKHSEGFKLITRLQDEAHRFAIEYHKSLRGKAQTHSFLDDIKGIGPARRKALMKHFENVDKMKEATEEELAAVESMSPQAAHRLYIFLHG